MIVVLRWMHIRFETRVILSGRLFAVAKIRQRSLNESVSLQWIFKIKIQKTLFFVDGYKFISAARRKDMDEGTEQKHVARR